MDMAVIAAGDGIKTIVATPHVNSFDLTPAMIRAYVAALNTRLSDTGIPVSVVTGGEVGSFLPPGLIKGYSINGNGYILLEFPHSHLPANASETIRHLTLEGLKVLLAHPERNPSVIRNPKVLAGLVEETGARVQVTANSITGAFGMGIRACARHLLKKGLVHVIASDAHSTGMRKPCLSEALDVAVKILGKEQAMRLVFDNPRAVIDGENIV